MATKGKKRYNRIKAVLAERDMSNVALSRKMGLTAAAVSRWCTNDAQPTLETLFKIAQLLNVDVCELIHREPKKFSA